MEESLCNKGVQAQQNGTKQNQTEQSRTLQSKGSRSLEVIQSKFFPDFHPALTTT